MYSLLVKSGHREGSPYGEDCHPVDQPYQEATAANAADVVAVERSHWPKYGSSCRSEYWGRMVQKCPGLRADGTPYSSISRRRRRCLDCSEVRIDKEYA